MVKYEIFNQTDSDIKEIKSIKKAINCAVKYEKLKDGIFNIIILTKIIGI